MIGGELNFDGDGGKIKINEDDCIFFENTKHKVSSFKIKKDKYKENLNKNGKDKNGQKIYGSRKLLGFFLVDNNNLWDNKLISVNCQYKVDYLVKYALDDIQDINIDDIYKDIINIIQKYVFGDKYYWKSIALMNRTNRYLIAKRIQKKTEKIEKEEAQKCD